MLQKKTGLMLLTLFTLACGAPEPPGGSPRTDAGTPPQDSGVMVADAGSSDAAATDAAQVIGPCPAARLVGPLPIQVYGDSTGAVSEFEASCAGSMGPDIAFVWTPDQTGMVRISTAQTAYDSVLTVLAGECAGAEIACNDDVTPSDVTSILDVSVTAGQPITIVVDALDPNDMGAFNLRIWRP